MSDGSLPLPSSEWAFFFDVDGTIVELAPSPSAIRLDVAVHALLRRLYAASLEDKGMTLALHYRRAPGLASFAHRTMRAVRQRAGPGHVLQQGKCVVELLPRVADKGSAILAFMAEAPFRGRTVVFVGDDLTDESGFAEVNRLGGYSVKVGNGTSTARWRLESVSAVKRWLERGAAANWASCTPADDASDHSDRGAAPHHITVTK
jgi:trehalose 6-phosphate phosphatase